MNVNNLKYEIKQFNSQVFVEIFLLLRRNKSIKVVHSWMYFPVTSTYISSRFKVLCFPSKYLCYNFNRWNTFLIIFWLSDYIEYRLYIYNAIYIIFVFIFYKGNAFKIYEWVYWYSGHKTIPNTLSPKISVSLRKCVIVFSLPELPLIPRRKKEANRTPKGKKMLYVYWGDKIFPEDRKAAYPGNQNTEKKQASNRPVGPFY